MAPSTRLSARPERRKDYRSIMLTGRAAGSVENPIVLEDSPPPQVHATRRTNTKDKDAPKRLRGSKSRSIKSETSPKPNLDCNKVVKAKVATKKEGKVRPDKVECLICATSKSTKRCFRASNVEGICEHFEGTCDLCVSKVVKSKISERQLADAHLSCVFPSCDAMLDHAALKKVLTKALFATWDTAVVKHLLAADPSFIACLNPKCGVYFSIEDCGGKKKSPVSKDKPGPKSQGTHVGKNKEAGDKATCPYCEHSFCLSCSHKWHSGSCDSVKQREDKKSEKRIKKMGAKACPQCGVNIEKRGGCDHMTCQRCRHNFCWECLGGFRGSANDHAETCSHHRPMIANDIGNFVNENLTIAQVNTLIERARQDRDAGRVPRPNMQLVPGVQIVNGAAVPVAPLQPPQPPPGQVPQGGTGMAVAPRRR